MTPAPNAPRPPRSEHRGPVVLVNTFFPKAGMLDAFVSLQIEEARRLADDAHAHGWRGNRIHRALDGTTAAIVTAFDSARDQERWAETPMFRDHLARMSPLLERIESRRDELVAENGLP